METLATTRMSSKGQVVIPRVYPETAKTKRRRTICRGRQCRCRNPENRHPT